MSGSRITKAIVKALCLSSNRGIYHSKMIAEDASGAFAEGFIENLRTERRLRIRKAEVAEVAQGVKRTCDRFSRYESYI